MLRYIIILNEPWVKVMMFILHLKQQFHFVCLFRVRRWTKHGFDRSLFLCFLKAKRRTTYDQYIYINLLHKSTLIDSRKKNQYFCNDIHSMWNGMHFMKSFDWKLAKVTELHKIICQFDENVYNYSLNGIFN